MILSSHKVRVKKTLDMSKRPDIAFIKMALLSPSRVAYLSGEHQS